jgi:hypothetical protein
MNLRQGMLVAGLFVTLGLSGWVAMREAVDSDAESIVRPVEKQARTPGSDRRSARTSVSGLPGATELRHDKLMISRAEWSTQAADIIHLVNFAPRSMPSRVVVSDPVAPPLPYRFVGAIEDVNGSAVFLLDGSHVRMVRVGDLIGSNYRLDRINSGEVVLTYLPLNLSQKLNRHSP